jgi:CheY-like chemotaxis protein
MQNVFIVDDDRIFQMLTKSRLQMIDTVKEMHTFDNGQACLEFILDNLQNSEKLPDIILLDINMPIMDGWEFVEEFAKLKMNNKISKPISIHIMSSSVNDKDIKRAENASDISSYTIKPVTQAKLQELCNSGDVTEMTNVRAF